MHIWLVLAIKNQSYVKCMSISNLLYLINLINWWIYSVEINELLKDKICINLLQNLWFGWINIIINSILKVFLTFSFSLTISFKITICIQPIQQWTMVNVIIIYFELEVLHFHSFINFVTLQHCILHWKFDFEKNTKS
jgi:hypothetical protein